MAFWNFCHNTLGLHVYVVLVIAFAIAMTVISLVHHKKQNKRDKENEDELEQLKEKLGLVPGSGENQTTEEVSRIAEEEQK